MKLQAAYVFLHICYTLLNSDLINTNFIGVGHPSRLPQKTCTVVKCKCVPNIVHIMIDEVGFSHKIRATSSFTRPNHHQQTEPSREAAQETSRDHVEPDTEMADREYDLVVDQSLDEENRDQEMEYIETGDIRAGPTIHISG